MQVEYNTAMDMDTICSTGSRRVLGRPAEGAPRWSPRRTGFCLTNSAKLFLLICFLIKEHDIMKIMNKILHSVFEVIYTAGAVLTQREDV